MKAIFLDRFLLKYWLLLFPCLLISCANIPTSTTQDNELLSAALQTIKPEKEVMIVFNRAGFYHALSLEYYDEDIIQRLSEMLNKKLDDYDSTPLLQLLFSKHQGKAPYISLKTDLSKGYSIESPRKHWGYFEKSGTGWDGWHKDFPDADGITTISLPAYDPKSGIFLIYKGTQRHGLNGEGWIIAFKLEGSTAKELARIMLWVS